MPEQLLTVLKICLLVLLYLFFLRVLRAVWAEVRDPIAIPVEPDAGRRRTVATDEDGACGGRPTMMSGDAFEPRPSDRGGTNDRMNEGAREGPFFVG